MVREKPPRQGQFVALFGAAAERAEQEPAVSGGERLTFVMVNRSPKAEATTQPAQPAAWRFGSSD